MRTHQIVAAAATALSVAGLSAAAAPPARAASPVVVYSCGMAGNWQCPAVRPGEVGFGALWDIAGMHWTHWTGGSAYGAGMYWLERGVGYRADIALTDVEHHGAQRYFRNAVITAHGHRAVHLWYGSNHGTVGWWKS